MKIFKTIPLFVILLLGLFWASQVQAFCVSDVDCPGGSCVNNECQSNPDIAKKQQTSVAGHEVPEAPTIILPTSGVDQRCWRKDECSDHRIKYFGIDKKEADTGFVANQETQLACGKEDDSGQPVGFCLPAGQSETKITFGGQRKFANIAELIQVIYRYGFVIASILAVIFIMIAGMQWIFSGGNTDAITKAKKHLGGAILGLMILAVSYSLLNLINPYLVNFRLPQVWLINPTSLPVEFCKDAPAGDTFSYLGPQNTIWEKAAYNTANFDLKYEPANTKLLKEKFACGDQLFYKKGAGTICRGHYCEPKNNNETQVCLKNGKEVYECVTGNIYGWIKNTELDLSVFTDWEEGADAVDDFDIYIVCDNGDYYQIPHNEVINLWPEGKLANYRSIINKKDLENPIGKCGSQKALAIGLLLFPDFNENWDWFDEAHWIGQTPGTHTGIFSNSNQAVDLGDSSNEAKYFNLIKDNREFGNYPARDYLLPIDAIYDGYQLNIDIGNIQDID